ncbi:MAG: DUF2059 domain-containing protein [Silvibacterium sp.]|nr:DUF2059 domain-containing protein [Silvibacterium sp.]MBV8437671.1 DUF2059 domain-containing protein [Silvibacterium sp.]
MRNHALAFSCILLAGVAAAQQTTGAPSATSAASQASKPPAAASSSAGASKAAPGAEPESQAPAHPLSDAQAHQMLELTGATKIKGQLTNGYMNYIHSSMPFLPKDVSDDLEQSFSKLDLDTPIIAVYKQHISADDADAIIAFYKTPAGKNMMETMPVILQQQQQVAVQQGRKTAQEVIQKHRPEIEAAAKKYQDEHAPKPAPSLSSPGASQSTPSTQPAPSSTTPSTTTPQPK